MAFFLSWIPCTGTGLDSPTVSPEPERSPSIHPLDRPQSRGRGGPSSIQYQQTHIIPCVLHVMLSITLSQVNNRG